VKLIAGLGNPGPRYAESRHNVGFLVVDELARRWGTEVTHYDRHFEGLLGDAPAGGQMVLLLKPATFMNLSGRSVAAVWRFYKLAATDVLVVHDDLDLPVGQVRVRASGSPGGHKGMDDVIRNLGTEDIPRLRIGIGKVQRDATVEYVLSRFDPDERPVIAAAVGLAADAGECWLRSGIDAAMNQFNRRKDREPRPPRPEDESRSEGDSF
jgi:PTH1 family peptidyl-tRNA hydrolase